MTRKEVCSQILTLVNSKPDLTLPAAAISDLIVNAKQQLLVSANEWVNGGAPEQFKGALFLLETAGIISTAELEKLTDLIEEAE